MIVPASHTARSVCRSCDAPIIWATSSTSRKSMPLDAEPHPDGTIDLDVARWVGAYQGQLAATVSSTLPLFDAGGMYRSHFASCPNADEYRKPR